MTKRKSATKPQPKPPKPKLDTIFNCPFCNSIKSVTCEMNKREKIGSLSCSQCDAHFTAPISAISEPIDLYSEWIDACEEVN